MPPIASPGGPPAWRPRPDRFADWQPIFHDADREFLESFDGPNGAAVTRYIAVYRLDPGGMVREVTHALEKPNGIALSPDERTLYVADNNNGTDRIDPTAPAPKPGAMKVYAFRLGADGFVKGPEKVLFDFGEETPSEVSGKASSGEASPQHTSAMMFVRPAVREIPDGSTASAYAPVGDAGAVGITNGRGLY